MEQRSVLFGLTGFSAVLAVLAMAFRTSSSPPVMESPRVSNDSVQITPALPEDVSALVGKYRKGRDLLEAYYGEALVPRRVAENPGAGDIDTIRTLIATIPDPNDSHLDWGYDAYLESLRRAFAHAGYVPDRFWLPARNEVLAIPGGNARVPAHDVHPGVFLFRPTDPERRMLWLLYIVLEIPTSGIHPWAFRAAVEEPRRLATLSGAQPRFTVDTSSGLRISGPIFSGSSRSLRVALDRARELHPGLGARIISGSATSAANRSTLAPEECLPGSAGCVSFHATVHTDEAMTTVLDTLLNRYGFDSTEVAVFTESATQYGADTLQKFLTIPFPLNIAGLRSEVDRARPADAAPAVPGISSGAARTRLSLDDGARPRESPVVMSRLTVPAIDIMLDDAMRALKRTGVKAVVLRATDVRDKLMLARELKQRSPNLQLITFENHGLFLRPEYSDVLHGMLVLTTYPLVAGLRGWFVGDRSNELAEPVSVDAAVGVRNATVALIDPSLPLDGYGPASARDTLGIPPVWIVTVGRRTFEPVRAVRPVVGQDYLWNASRTGGTAQTHTPPSMTILILLLIALHVTAMGIVVYRGRLTAGDGDRHHVSALGFPRPGDPAQDFFYALVLWSAAVVVMTLVVSFAARALVDYGNSGPLRWMVWISIAMGTALFGVGGYNVRRYVASLRRPVVAAEDTPDARLRARRDERSTLVGRAAILIVAAFSLLWFVLCLTYVGSLALVIQSGGPDARAQLHRVAMWSSAASPLPMILVLGVGFLVWSWWQLQQAREAEPRWIEVTLERMAPGFPELVPMRNGLYLMHRAQRWFTQGTSSVVLGTIILALLLYALHTGFRSMESLLDLPGPWSLYRWVLALGFLGLVTTTTWAVHRAWAVWQVLESLLDQIAELPILHAFGRLPRSLGERMSGFIGFGTTSDSIIRRDLWREANDAVALLDIPVTLKDDEARAMHAAVQNAFAPMRRAGPLPESSHCAMALGTLLGTWRVTQLRPSPQSAEWDTTGLHRNAIIAIRAVENYLAVEIVDLIDRALLNVRRISFCLLLTLIGGVVGLASYPFLPQDQVKLVFIALLAATIGCLFIVMTRMSRHDVLSRLTRTTPGKVNWDTTMMLNLIVFGALPLLAILSAQFPSVRAFFFSWADPMLKAVSKL